MAKLTAAGRKALPTSDFAGLGRSYPIQDRRHAVNAKARASQQFAAGKLSESEYKEIVSKANRKLKGARK